MRSKEGSVCDEVGGRGKRRCIIINARVGGGERERGRKGKRGRNKEKEKRKKEEMRG